MTEIRETRLSLNLSQSEFAARLGLSGETYRTWDSGRRPTPPPVLARARELATQGRGDHPLTLPELARVLRVQERTLRKAAQHGRLAITYSTRVFFGKPIPRATRAAGETFKRLYYRRVTRWTERSNPPTLLPVVPEDYHLRVIGLRRRLGLTQTELAVRLGAAGKAVVYQWESRKRKPSPVLWSRVVQLEGQAQDLPESTRAGREPSRGPR